MSYDKYPNGRFAITNIRVLLGGGGRHAAFAEGSTAYIGANLAPEKTPPVQPTKEFSRIRAHAILLRPLPL